MYFTSVVVFSALTFLLSARASPVLVDDPSRVIDAALASVTPPAVRSSIPRGAAPDPQTSMPSWRMRAIPESANNGNPDWRRDLISEGKSSTTRT
ncbi:hypothetical protein CPB84DRAFT_1961050 [Gymnopilus junonius]|uniref:Uncharacterized protein n=1 Tax=Gymnopilus junonius TaxID=109634 RepID=A0A9P5TQI0_GYMJU|nr:hypothetical protein CPB84DRAFT_1961050 [Gymnopilus junonius]